MAKLARLRSIVSIEKAAKRGIGSNLDPYRWTAPEIGKDSPPAGKTEPLGIQLGEAA